MSLFQKELIISEQFEVKSNATLFIGDRLDLINQIYKSEKKAELIITSPPYNLGKEYENVIPLEEYLKQQEITIEACMSILSDTGSICWQVGNFIKGDQRNKETFPLDILLYPIFKKFNLRLKNRIVWTFGHGLNENYRFSGRHETILWFTKNTRDFTFNLDSIRIPQKYPSKKSFKGNNVGNYSGNPLGKNPEDVWDMPNVKSNHVEKTEHPCQFPIGLIERFVLGMTDPDDLVFDPYIGVGTTAVAALKHNRKAAGSDIEKKYIEIARERIHSLNNGTLPYRDRDKPVYDPSLSNLSKVPDEWKQLRIQ